MKWDDDSGWALVKYGAVVLVLLGIAGLTVTMQNGLAFRFAFFIFGFPMVFGVGNLIFARKPRAIWVFYALLICFWGSYWRFFVSGG